MHGNIRELVCPECGAVSGVTPAGLRDMRARRGIPCPAPGCPGGQLRMRVMLYDDGEGAPHTWSLLLNTTGQCQRFCKHNLVSTSCAVLLGAWVGYCV